MEVKRTREQQETFGAKASAQANLRLGLCLSINFSYLFLSVFF